METFNHKAGQTFENHLEFVTKFEGGDKKLILAKSMYSIRPPGMKIIEENDTKYFAKNHWFVLYGSKFEKEYDMGIIRLAYPISTRALTLKSALYHFHKMVKDIDKVNFIKIDHIDKPEKCITY